MEQHERKILLARKDGLCSFYYCVLECGHKTTSKKKSGFIFCSECWMKAEGKPKQMEVCGG